uniref:(northern house mosquito) hypothetical protein n=1 Tax=Culex pipiens TaxID=7175 RepID=A0A8D8D3P5_CULPI
MMPVLLLLHRNPRHLRVDFNHGPTALQPVVDAPPPGGFVRPERIKLKALTLIYDLQLGIQLGVPQSKIFPRPHRFKPTPKLNRDDALPGVNDRLGVGGLDVVVLIETGRIRFCRCGFAAGGMSSFSGA